MTSNKRKIFGKAVLAIASQNAKELHIWCVAHLYFALA